MTSIAFLLSKLLSEKSDEPIKGHAAFHKPTSSKVDPVRLVKKPTSAIFRHLPKSSVNNAYFIHQARCELIIWRNNWNSKYNLIWINGLFVEACVKTQCCQRITYIPFYPKRYNYITNVDIFPRLSKLHTLFDLKDKLVLIVGNTAKRPLWRLAAFLCSSSSNREEVRTESMNGKPSKPPLNTYYCRRRLQSGRGNMVATASISIVFFVFSGICGHNGVYGDQKFPLLMPKAKPSQEEAYICTPIRLSDTETFFVTKFTPNATAHTAHHMLVSWYS